MGWDDGRKDTSNSFKAIAVESILEKIEQ